jgi:ATP-dependent DNA helicase PIF1
MSLLTENLIFTDEFSNAYDAMELDKACMFIHGQAGSGKSTLLEWFRSNTTKKHVILAPTGVAALNVRGETIHSFFKFKPSITPDDAKIKGARGVKKKYKAIDCIVIDEISMVRADLFDCMDQFLKSACNSSKPFGGKQVIMIGDLYQLPPVLKREERATFSSYYGSPYFFSSQVMKQVVQELRYIELSHVFRQKDNEFIHLLQKIRNNTISREQLDALNQQSLNNVPSEKTIHLVPTNREADRINEIHLDKLPSETIYYSSETEGDIDKMPSPTSSRLGLKKGSRVMLLNNDTKGCWVNGTLATIETLTPQDITVRKENGRLHSLYKHKWSYYKYSLNTETNQLEQKEVGAFTQFPIRLAWAITIHKSQGLTYDNLILNTSRGLFSHGQCYVALSRCRTLEGLTFSTPLQKRDIILDKIVVDFLAYLKNRDD